MSIQHSTRAIQRLKWSGPLGRPRLVQRRNRSSVGSMNGTAPAQPFRASTSQKV